MKNSKLKIVFLITFVILFLGGFLVFWGVKKNQERSIGADVAGVVESGWISAGFENSPYAINIWYPKRYLFIGGGDTEAGTFNDIKLPSGEVLVQAIEDATFCFDIEKDSCVSPEVFYKEKINRKEVIQLENYASKNLGTSVFAYIEHSDKNYISNSENYVFKIPEGYYKVSFNRDQHLSDDFKNEFINKLEIIK